MPSGEELAVRRMLEAMAVPVPSAYRFCKVLSVVAGVSATLDYGGAALVIPKARMFCRAFPTAGTVVLVGVNGLDRFILGVPLP